MHCCPCACRRKGYRGGSGIQDRCKLAVVDDTENLLNTQISTLMSLRIKGGGCNRPAYIQKYDIRLIAIGNGTASRETDEFGASAQDVPPEKRPVSVV